LKNFGQLFKLGINSDFTNKDRLTHLLRYESTRTEKGVLTSLKDYISRMDSDQNSIYYVSGDSRENLFNSPKLEYFKKQNIEVLLLTDPSDIFTVPYIFEYEGKKLESIEKAEIKQDDSKKSTDENSISEQQQQDVIAKFKSVLSDKVEDVVVSMRLVNSPATLVQGKDGMDTHTERLMKMMDKNFTGTKRVLEINTSHPLIKNISILLEDSSNEEFASKSIQHIYESCLLLEGMLNDPNEYFQRMSELLTKATTK
jgi:molecular chaperone HtpG